MCIPVMTFDLFDSKPPVPSANSEDTVLPVKGSSNKVYLLRDSVEEFLASDVGQRALRWDRVWWWCRAVLATLFEAVLVLSVSAIFIHSGREGLGLWGIAMLLGFVALFSIVGVGLYYLLCVFIGSQGAPHKQLEKALANAGAVAVRYDHACPYANVLGSRLVDNAIMDAVIPEYRDWVFAQRNLAYCWEALLRSVDMFVHESMFHSRTPLDRNNLPESLVRVREGKMRRDSLGGASGVLHLITPADSGAQEDKTP